MSTTTTTAIQKETSHALKTSIQDRLPLDGRPTNYGDFRDALNRDGFAVIKGAVPKERALGYSNDFYSYLEGL